MRELMNFLTVILFKAKENRKQKTENRKQKTENRKQKTEKEIGEAIALGQEALACLCFERIALIKLDSLNEN